MSATYAAKEVPSVYIMVNSQISHLVKIGWTRRTPEERAREVMSSGGAKMPGIVSVAFSVQTPDAYRIEQAAHRMLAGKRKGGEWFEMSVEEAKIALAQIAPDAFAAADAVRVEAERRAEERRRREKAAAVAAKVQDAQRRREYQARRAEEADMKANPRSYSMEVQIGVARRTVGFTQRAVGVAQRAVGSAVRFKTEREADAYAKEVCLHLPAVRAYRVVERKEAPTHAHTGRGYYLPLLPHADIMAINTAPAAMAAALAANAAAAEAAEEAARSKRRSDAQARVLSFCVFGVLVGGLLALLLR